MKLTKLFLITGFFCSSLFLFACQHEIKTIERPEKIVSKREIVYDTDTYVELAKLWKDYYEEFPSEDAYANWMYATRYADLSDYKSLLENGLKKYPANPTFLYLSAMTKHGSENNLEGIHLLERAVKLDPSYIEPWFSLVVNYMAQNDNEKLDVALKKILEKGGVADEVLDYNYNMISCLEENAVLITNGDNDTFPGWILTRILKFRPDVKIVNRSLLNTNWYPFLIMNNGVPKFIMKEDHAKLGEEIYKAIKENKIKLPSQGPMSDTLLVYLIQAAERENIPLYFSETLYTTDVVERYKISGQNLGLVL